MFPFPGEVKLAGGERSVSNSGKQPGCGRDCWEIVRALCVMGHGGHGPGEGVGDQLKCR